MKPLRLKKRLGQHHLVNESICAPLLGYLQPADHHVVEIGPGAGILTRPLLDASRRVQALELDLEWAIELRRRIGEPGRRKRLRHLQHLQIAVADALAIDWPALPPPTLVTGNLPYQISTQLIERLVPLHDRIPRMAFLVQREVADRLAARPGSKDYGALGVWCQAHARVEVLGRVKRGSFRPPPQVEGAFVGFSLRPPPLRRREMDGFLETLRCAFGQRRKTLKNALAAGWGRDQAEGLLSELGLKPKVRAEELELAAFLEIHAARRRLRL